MSDSEDDSVEKQLKIVIVGEAGCGKVKNMGPSGIFRKAACFVLVFNLFHFRRFKLVDTFFMLEEGFLIC